MQILCKKGLRKASTVVLSTLAYAFAAPVFIRRIRCVLDFNDHTSNDCEVNFESMSCCVRQMLTNHLFLVSPGVVITVPSTLNCASSSSRYLPGKPFKRLESLSKALISGMTLSEKCMKALHSTQGQTYLAKS